jgi:hypothetical protein
MSLQKIIGTDQDNNQLRDIVISDFKIANLARGHCDSQISEMLNKHVVSANLNHIKWLSGEDLHMVTDVKHSQPEAILK